MAINVVNVQDNGGFLTDIILLTMTQGYLLLIPSSGKPFQISNDVEEILYL